MENCIPKDFYCEICPLQFGNMTVYDMHMSLVHNIKAKSTNIKKTIKRENEIFANQNSIVLTNATSAQTISTSEDGNTTICDDFVQNSNVKEHLKLIQESKKAPNKKLLTL